MKVDVARCPVFEYASSEYIFLPVARLARRHVDFLGVPGMGIGLEVQVLCGASW